MKTFLKINPNGKGRQAVFVSNEALSKMLAEGSARKVHGMPIYEEIPLGERPVKKKPAPEEPKPTQVELKPKRQTYKTRVMQAEE